MQRNTKIRIRSGASYARGQNIDPFLSRDEVEFLYSNWPKDWPILNFQGGEKAITCETVKSLGLENLAKVFKGNGVYGKRFREKLMEVSIRNSVI